MSSEENDSGSVSNKGRISLRLSSIAAGVFLALAAVALAYIGGVMSGRNTVNIVESRKVIEKVEKIPEAPGDILTAEELDFARVLRGKAARTPEASKKEVDKPQTAKDIDQSQTAENPLIQTPKETAAKPESTGDEQGKSVQPSTKMLYDYIFQVAAFRDESGADNLRQKLEGYGLRTRLERSGKMYIVLIALRGNEERAVEIADIARRLKLGELMLRSRKAAPN